MHHPWLKALDLAQWAPHNDARHTMPAAVRRLIWATTKGKTEFSFPAGEQVQRPSWDGKLTVAQGNVWVPDGASVWEISTGDSAATKAAENYQKRTDSTAATDAAALTFVFVTPRSWPAKQAWVDDRKAEGIWKDVRVIDSDDLEHWLEAAPAVDIWLARVVGKVPVGVHDLSSRWSLLSAITTPPLPVSAFLAGRQPARDELRQALNGPPAEIAVGAMSEQEVIDFVAAAFGSLQENDKLPSRLVLVETREAWDQIVKSTEPLVLMPSAGLTIDRSQVAQAVKGGHHLVTRRPYSAVTETGVVRLPRAWRHELGQALIAAGFTEERAERLARESGGCLTVLQRLAAPNAGTALPVWARDPDGLALAPFILFGSWDDANKADREVVAQLAGLPYDNALALASGWLVRPESPFRRSGTKWHLVSREDAWIHLAPRLTRPMLEEFSRLAVGVVGEDDPRFDLSAEQRMFASIKGQLPKHSSDLKEGFAETLALLGADIVSVPGLPGRAGPGYARRVVRDLLPAGMPARRWFTLGPVLGLLAEAAPEEFLAAVEHDLDAAQPAVLGLFSDDDGGIFGGGSRHYHLMWALAALAWHPAYLAPTALVLAQLAALDPGGKTSPRPAGTLNDVFRLWYPQTGASAEDRFQVIDLLIAKMPVEAWKLLLKLLPTGHDAASPTSPPRWREWPSKKSPRVTRAENHRQILWTAERLLHLALPDPAKRLVLTEQIDHLPDKEFGALADHLQALDPVATPAADRLALWQVLHDLIRKHEFFNTAEWAMEPERLARLRLVEAALRPAAPAERGRWLFVQHHLYMGTHKANSHEEQEAMAFEQRRALLAEILAAGGLAAVVDFAVASPVPGLVGNVLGRSKLFTDWKQILPTCLLDERRPVVVFARCYAATVFAERGWAWVDALPLNEWPAVPAVELLLSLPCLPQAWERAKSLGPEVEAEYWKQADVFPRDLDDAQSAHALSMLLKHGRPLWAADCVPMVYHNKRTLPATLLAEVLDDSVAALNEAASGGRDVSMVIHDLEETLRFLQEAPDADPVRVAKLEWIYLPLMEHCSVSPKFLHRELARDPGFFAQCVELVWPKDGMKAEKTEAGVAQAKLAYQLLNSWSHHPCLLAEGGPDEAGLRKWVDDARARCGTAGRLEACDHEIGGLLASSPGEADGSWPCVAVRNTLEAIPGNTALDAFQTGIFNDRGVTSRGIHDGGEQERTLAKKYHGYADACQMRWPRVAATLRRLAVGYEHDARHMDDCADDHV